MDHAALPDGGLIPHPDIDRLLPTEYQQQALEDLAPIAADLVEMQAEKGALDNLYEAAGDALFATDNQDEMIAPGAIILGPAAGIPAVSLHIARFTSTTNDPSAGTYIHIKTPWTKGQYKMYFVRAQGYGLRAKPGNSATFVDVIWSGYLYSTSPTNVSNHDPSGNLTLSQYVSANSPYNLYLRLGPLNPYHLALTIHAVRVGGYGSFGDILYPGDVTVSASTSAAL